MTKEEIAKRFCKFELCTHRNGEGMCCLYNQDNCIFHRLEKENAELKVRLNAINLLTPELEKMSKLKKQQLTEATKLLKEAQVYIENIDEDSDEFYDKINEFIKEIEK